MTNIKDQISQAVSAHKDEIVEFVQSAVRAPSLAKATPSQGVEVHTYDGTEISLKGAGGPTCITRPFFRSAS